MQIDQELKDYYNRSDVYMREMRSHDDSYFTNYINLISKYTMGADNLLEVGCGPGASTRAIASINIQVGNDADAVTDMCNLDIYNFFKKANWKILNISWPRGNSKGGALISTLLPFLGSMGIVAQKPLIK